MRKRHDKAVEVRARDVLKVAARYDSAIQRHLDHAEVFIHRLFAGEVHLVEDVVVRAGDENARLANAQLLDKVKVTFGRANPRRNLRETIAAVAAELQRFAILLAVDEELALADQPVRAAQLVHHVKQAQNLLRRKRRTGLLTVAEGRVGDPNLFRHAHGHEALVERDLRNLVKIEDFREQICFGDILHVILIIVLAQ